MRNAERKTMKHSELIRIWLYQALHKQQAAYQLLNDYGYQHNWITQGDLGGALVSVNKRFFSFDPSGLLMVIQAVWYEQPSPSNEVKCPLLYDLIAWHPRAPKDSSPATLDICLSFLSGCMAVCSTAVSTSDVKI